MTENQDRHPCDQQIERVHEIGREMKNILAEREAGLNTLPPKADIQSPEAYKKAILEHHEAYKTKAQKAASVSFVKLLMTIAEYKTYDERMKENP